MEHIEKDAPAASCAGQDPPLIARIPSPHTGVTVDPEALEALVASAGLSRLRYGRKYVLPPVERLAGIELSSFAPGMAAYSMPASAWLQWEEGIVADGVLALLADAAHTGAVLSTAGPATGFLTAELSLMFCEPVLTGAGVLRARGKAVSAAGEHVLSTVEITGPDGRLACLSTARSSFLPLPSSLPGPPGDAVLAELADTAAPPGPFQLPAEGRGMPVPVTAAGTGAECLRSWMDGAAASLPLRCFTGIAPLAAGDGQCTFAVPANAWLCSHAGSLQGGVVSLAAERAAWGAVLAGLRLGESCRVLDVKVNYFHQMAEGPGMLRVTAGVVHQSKRIAVVSMRAEDDGERPLAAATATVALTRPRARAAPPSPARSSPAPSGRAVSPGKEG
jgi:uncharacterized protein (TIGR00369 family)